MAHVPVSRRWRWMLVCALLLAGCGAVRPAQEAAGNHAIDDSRACPDAPGPVRGAIVVGGDNTLYAIDPASGDSQALTDMPADAYVFGPAWSLDSRAVAYTLARPAEHPTLSWLPVGIICAFDRDTGRGLLLAQHAQPLVSLTDPAWTRDGSILLTRHQPMLGSDGQYIGNEMAIVRVELQSGTMTTIVERAQQPALSPQGRLAFVSQPENGIATMMIASADGSNAAPVPDTDPPLGYITAPRWSPDGRQVVFAASGGPVARESPARPQPALVERLMGVRVARAHGEPMRLWIASDDGTPPRLLLPALLDDPQIAWSPDGSSIAYVQGGGGVSIVDFASGQARQITTLGNFGGIAWRNDG